MPTMPIITTLNSAARYIAGRRKAIEDGKKALEESKKTLKDGGGSLEEREKALEEATMARDESIALNAMLTTLLHISGKEDKRGTGTPDGGSQIPSAGTETPGGDTTLIPSGGLERYRVRKRKGGRRIKNETAVKTAAKTAKKAVTAVAGTDMEKSSSAVTAAPATGPSKSTPSPSSPPGFHPCDFDLRDDEVEAIAATKEMIQVCFDIFATYDTPGESASVRRHSIALDWWVAQGIVKQIIRAQKECSDQDDLYAMLIEKASGWAILKREQLQWIKEANRLRLQLRRIERQQQQNPSRPIEFPFRRFYPVPELLPPLIERPLTPPPPVAFSWLEHDMILPFLPDPPLPIPSLPRVCYMCEKTFDSGFNCLRHTENSQIKGRCSSRK